MPSFIVKRQRFLQSASKRPLQAHSVTIYNICRICRALRAAKEEKMTPRQEQIVRNVDKYRQDILDAERWSWKHPEVGYTDWQTNAYMLEKFREYGYEPIE
jgi:hypothetical protein